MIAQPIRIVPLYAGPAAAPVTPVRLTYRGGPLLNAVQVVTAFWGAEWLADEAPLLTQINDFFLYILDSPLMDQLAEYSVPGTQIAHGSLAGTEIITDTQPGSTVTDAEVKNLITFSRLNLQEDSKMRFMKGMDLIFCCNVLIYFDAPSKSRVIDHFFSNLNFGGYFFLGTSESLIKLNDKFHLVHFPGAIGYWKPSLKSGKL